MKKNLLGGWIVLLFVGGIWAGVGLTETESVSVINPKIEELKWGTIFSFEGPGNFKTTAIPGGCEINISYSAGRGESPFPPFRLSLINPYRGTKTTLASEGVKTKGWGVLDFARLNLFVLEIGGRGRWSVMVSRFKGGGCLGPNPKKKAWAEKRLFKKVPLTKQCAVLVNEMMAAWTARMQAEADLRSAIDAARPIARAIMEREIAAAMTNVRCAYAVRMGLAREAFKDVEVDDSKRGEALVAILDLLANQ